jgi:hypothetical protein
VEMPVTDSPRLLTIEDGGDGPPAGVPEGGDPPVVVPEGGVPPVVVPEGDPESSPVQPPLSDLPRSTPAPTGAEVGPVSPDAPPAGLSVELRGGQTLLRKRRLEVLARCQARCTVTVKGNLLVGRHRYPMLPNPDRAIASDAVSTPMTVELGITPELAQLARRALADGTSVKATVQVRAKGEAGKSLSSEQLVIHR